LYVLGILFALLWDLIEGTLPLPVREGLSQEQVSLVLQAPGRRKYNIVPTSFEPILYTHEGKTVFAPAFWWLLPSWARKQIRWRVSAKGEKTFTWVGPPGSHFNSRWDILTRQDNHYWHGLLDSKRCLIPADGFVEWPDDALRPKDQDKIPHYFSLHEHRPFFFAGIYDIATDDEGKPFMSYNVITVEPNAMLKRLPHHRMPAILSDESVAKWLSPSVRAAEAGKLLKPTSDDLMVEYPISKMVNTPKNESAAMLEPISG
jgi:putative SOS response-associated peptidase YedK